MKTMTLLDVKRGMKVQLQIPAMRPIKLLNGTLLEAGQTFKVLGTHGTCVRLSRVGDNAKAIINVEVLTEVK